jgi:putative spermidine/putrescine transport system substrate-binding protein
MMAQVARLKGEQAELWAELDGDKLPEAENLYPHFVHRYPDERINGIGAVSWYITLVTNTETYPEAPTSWKALWDPENADRIGLLALVIEFLPARDHRQYVV